MERFWKDLQYATRTLLKKPGFTLVVLLTLALGIGANTAIFSVVSAVILRPLPFREPEQLVNIWEGRAGTVYRRGEESRFIYVRPGTFHDWREQSQSFQSMASYSWRTMLLTGRDKAEMLWANHVTEGFFETLGTRAELGRTFSADDYGPGAGRVVILSHKLWRSRFGSDTAIVGHDISLDNQAYIVVGVMPEGFYPTRFNAPDLWTPRWFSAGEKYDRVAWGLTTFARLKPGVTIEQATSEMRVVAKAIETSHPEHYQDMGAVLVPADAELIGNYGELFLFLLSAVGLVLLVACVNVANLLLARTTDREQEFSVRAALGASRGRIVGQLLTESLLLSGTGTVLGLLLAYLAIPPVVSLLPDTGRIPRLDAVKLDLTVLGFTLLVAIVTGVLFGLAPALRASRVDLNEALKEAGRGNTASARGRRLGELLVIGEVASSLVLLVGAGLLVQSFQRMQRIESGFKPAKLLTLKIEVPEYRYGKYETGGKNSPRMRLYKELEQRIAALPGVESVAVTGKLPMKHGPNPWSVSVEGRDAPPRNPEGGLVARNNKTGLYNHGSTSDQRVSPAYFSTLGMKLIRGRMLDESDRPDAPMAAVVNEAFVRKFFPDEDPIGKRVVVDYTSWFPKINIVGVVADAKLNGLDRNPFAEMFWPMAQAPSQNVWLIIRTAGDPLALASSVQREIRAVDRDLPTRELSPMETVIADSLWRPRFSAVLIGLFAGLALTLAAAGIYGVMSYSVSRRAHEMGLRIALGATARTILRLVVVRGLWLTGIGVMIGLTVSLSLSKLIAGHLYGIKASDPLTMIVLSLFLMSVAALACFIPAWRAACVDPMVVLRYE
jgi:putative ABC transport system permease protein